MAEILENNDIAQNEEAGIIQIADDVVASIVGLAVTEVDGVSKLTGNITREIVAKLGKNNLSKGVVVEYDENQKAEIYKSVTFYDKKTHKITGNITLIRTVDIPGTKLYIPEPV